jgi:ketosteroid isomerase-like protein
MNEETKWIGEFSTEDCEDINALRAKQVSSIENGDANTYSDICTAASAESPKDYSNHRKYSHVMRKTNEGWRFAVLMSNNNE